MSMNINHRTGELDGVSSLNFFNATSGSLTLVPVTGPLGTVIVSLPAVTDQLIGRTTTDTLTNKTLTSPSINGNITLNGDTVDVSTLLNKIPNIKDFGAVGDSNGTTGNGTNDTAAINTALATGGLLYLPAGTYRVVASAGSPALIASVENTTLFMDPDAIIFLDSDDTNSHAMSIRANGVNIIGRGQFVGSWDNSASGTDNVNDGYSATKLIRIIPPNENGTWIGNIKISGVRFRLAGGQAVAANFNGTAGFYNITVEECIFEDNYSAIFINGPIQTDHAHTIKIINNKVLRTASPASTTNDASLGGNAITVHGPVDNVEINGNYVEGCGRMGIEVWADAVDLQNGHTSYNLTLRNNRISPCIYRSISTGAINTLIEDNYVVGHTQGLDFVEVGGDNCIVRNNRLIGSGILFLGSDANQPAWLAKGVFIEYNKLEDMEGFSQSAIFVGQYTDALVQNNNITYSYPVASGEAPVPIIYARHIDGVWINNNNVTVSEDCIRSAIIQVSVCRRGEINNNYIKLEGTVSVVDGLVWFSALENITISGNETVVDEELVLQDLIGGLGIGTAGNLKRLLRTAGVWSIEDCENEIAVDPPVSPTLGQIYVVGDTPTGDWASNPRSFAEWDGADWVFNAIIDVRLYQPSLLLPSSSLYGPDVDGSAILLAARGFIRCVYEGNDLSAGFSIKDSGGRRGVSIAGGMKSLIWESIFRNNHDHVRVTRDIDSINTYRLELPSATETPEVTGLYMAPGSIVSNSLPDIGDFIGWVRTSSDTWKGFGLITTYTLPSADGTSGQGLTTDGSGNVTWQDINATTLDTLDSTQFLRSDTSDAFTSGTLTFNSGTTVAFSNTTGTSPFTVTSTTLVSNLNADRVDGLEATAFLLVSNNLSEVTPSTARTNLGLVIGTHVQAYDADLDTLSGLDKTDGNFIVANGTNWVVESGSTVRTSLGLGSLATLSSINDGNWSGTDLAVANGGTGASDAGTARTNLGLIAGGTGDIWVEKVGDEMTGTLTLSSSARILNTIGSAGAPSYAFATDINTGMFQDGADTISWAVGGVERLNLGSTGNLTITIGSSGATANTTFDDLVIESSTSAGISILTPNTATATIAFGDPEDNDVGYISYDHSTNHLGFVVTGNIAIGSASFTPLGKLHIQSGSAGGGTISSVGDELVLENSTFAGMTILTPNTSAAFIRFGDTDNNGPGAISYAHTTDKLSFTAGTALRLTVNATGTVVSGESTTSSVTPLGGLHVYSAASGVSSVNSGANELVIENSTTGGISILTPNTNQGRIAFGDPENNIAAIFSYDHSVDRYYFDINSSSKVTMDTTRVIINPGSSGVATPSGNGLVIESDTNSILNILSPNTHYGSIFFGDPESSTVGYMQYIHSSNSFIFGSNGIDQLTIDVSGNVILNDAALRRVKLQDYAEISTSPASASNVLTLNIENGNNFQVTLTENITTLTISNPVNSGSFCPITVKITQGAGPYTVAWPASFVWPNGIPGAVSTGNGFVDILNAVTWDGGTTWFAVLNNNFA